MILFTVGEVLHLTAISI